MVLRFPFGFVWAFFSPGEGFSSTQEDWALGRFICQWTIHCCYCWSFCVLATTISFLHLSSLPQNSSGRSFHHGGVTPPPHLIRRLGYQSTFRIVIDASGSLLPQGVTGRSYRRPLSPSTSGCRCHGGAVSRPRNVLFRVL